MSVGSRSSYRSWTAVARVTEKINKIICTILKIDTALIHQLKNCHTWRRGCKIEQRKTDDSSCLLCHIEKKKKEKKALKELPGNEEIIKPSSTGNFTAIVGKQLWLLQARDQVN